MWAIWACRSFSSRSLKWICSCLFLSTSSPSRVAMLLKLLPSVRISGVPAGVTFALKLPAPICSAASMSRCIGFVTVRVR